MSELIDKFRTQFLVSLSNYKLRQQSDIWLNFRKLLLLFEGCESWLINIQRWNQYKIWSLLERPQKLVKLVQNYKLNIQKMHPQNVELATDNLQYGDNIYSQYLAQLIEYIVDQYNNLINEEQIANYLDESEGESRMKTQESCLDFQEQPSMNLSLSKPNSALRNSNCTKRSSTTDKSNTLINLQKHKQELQQQIKQQKEILRDLQEQHNKTIQKISRLNSTSKIDKIINSFSRSRRFIC